MTAVEWLLENVIISAPINWDTTIVEQAKEMEKQQIIDAHTIGQDENPIFPNNQAESIETNIPFTNSIENSFGNETVSHLEEDELYIEELSNEIDKRNYNKHELVTMILSFKCLQGNWDGFKALPLEIESASNTFKLIDLVGENVFCTVEDVFPNPNGTISLLWTNDSNEELSVEIGNKTMSYYYKSASNDPQFFNNILINSREAKNLSRFIEAI